MARVNINILGINELKWTGMGEFNSDDHYIHYCGQESLRRNGVTIIVNKRVWNGILGCNLKNNRMIWFFPKQTIQLQLLHHYWSGHRLGLPWYWMICLGNNRDHSVIFEISSKYCISDSLVDHDGYSISSKGFLPQWGKNPNNEIMLYCVKIIQVKNR